jgi:pimeloyl-ACP methyl ester carboxylesterase
MTTPLVLVHGGAHGAWCWEPTMPFLPGPVLAVDLPPKSIRGVPALDPPPPEVATVTLDDWATSTIADIDAAGFADSNDGRFVLVGHSMGGLTINEIARRIPERVTHLVFVSAMVPAEGALVMDGAPSSTHDAVQAAIAESGDESSNAGLSPARIRAMFCNDMDEQQTQFVLDHTGTEAFGVFSEQVTRQGIPPALPKVYVRLLQDQALPLSDQDRAIENLCDSPGGEVEVIELDTGHDVMISAPAVLAEVLDEIANRTEP